MNIAKWFYAVSCTTALTKLMTSFRLHYYSLEKISLIHKYCSLKMCNMTTVPVKSKSTTYCMTCVTPSPVGQQCLPDTQLPSSLLLEEIPTVAWRTSTEGYLGTGNTWYQLQGWREECFMLAMLVQLLLQLGQALLQPHWLPDQCSHAPCLWSPARTLHPCLGGHKNCSLHTESLKEKPLDNIKGSPTYL